MNGKLRVRIRGYRQRDLRIDETLAVGPADIDGLVERHARTLGTDGSPFLIEFEFLDEPDPTQRFFRFGTDPSGMVMPIWVKLQ
jgi:hypothetical protein